MPVASGVNVTVTASASVTDGDPGVTGPPPPAASGPTTLRHGATAVVAELTKAPGRGPCR